MSKTLNLLIVFISLCLSVGCTTFVKSELMSEEQVLQLHKNAPQDVKVYVKADFEWVNLDKSKTNYKQNSESAEEHKKAFQEILSRSMGYTIVSSEDQADIVWETKFTLVDDTQRGFKSVWGIVSAITLNVIPFWDTQSYFQLDSKVLDKKSKNCSYESSHIGRFTTFNQTLMILAMPFMAGNPFNLMNSLRREGIASWLKERKGSCTL